MARRMFRRAGTVVLGLILAVSVGAGSPVVAAPPSGLPAPAALRADPKWYQVQPAYKGQPEFLYEIAERFLGTGNRLNEIFQLNKDRVQVDGRRMEKPESIEPGWILILPADAKGDGVQTGPLPVVPTVAAPSDSAPSSAPAPSPEVVTPAAADDSSTPLLPLILLIVAGLLVIAAVLGAYVLLRRRRAGGAPAGLPFTRAKPAAAPPRSFDTAAAWTIDRALRVLVTSAGAAGRPVPAVYGVSLDENRMVLRLAAPDGEPVEPWEAVENGRIWQASLRDLQALPADADAASPCPRLVTLGTAGGTRELADLGQATGVVSVQGDPTAARELVTGWAEELSSSPWAGGVRVIAAGLRVDLAGGDRLSAADSVRDALAAAEGSQSDGSYALRGGQSTQGGSALGVLILSSAPGTRDMERVQNLVNRPDAAWVVIVLGQTRQDRWRFTVAADGRLDTGALGITVYAGGIAAGSAR